MSHKYWFVKLVLDTHTRTHNMHSELQYKMCFFPSPEGEGYKEAVFIFYPL